MNQNELLEKTSKLFEELIFDILKLQEYCDIEHLKETPKRIAKMYVNELLTGVYGSPDDLIKEFPMENPDENYQNPVIVRDIEVRSLCSHHFMPFFGTCDIVYIPDKTIIGLSKFSRIVDFFSRKPQVQENLTNEIIDFINDKVKPKGIAVKIKAVHLCMRHRGAKSNGEMETFAIRAIDQPTKDLLFRLLHEK